MAVEEGPDRLAVEGVDTGEEVRLQGVTGAEQAVAAAEFDQRGPRGRDGEDRVARAGLDQQRPRGDQAGDVVVVGQQAQAGHKVVDAVADRQDTRGEAGRPRSARRARSCPNRGRGSKGCPDAGRRL